MQARRSDWMRRAERLAAACGVARLHPTVVATAASARARGPWFVAFSGGADSLALLLLVWAHWPGRRDRLHAVHFNHRLRGAASDRDEAFCRRVCAGLGLKLHVGRRTGVEFRHEAEARAARFDYMERQMLRHRARVLWLGHQQNDIAESLLMRLARGSGSGGLAAPRPCQSLPGRIHLRPLLAIRHEELATLLRTAKTPWREDGSNATGRHFRNRVRADVLPAWQRAADRDVFAGAARARELLEEDDAALELLADTAARFDRRGGLELEFLSGQPRAIQRRALHRWWLRQRGIGDLSRQAFEALLADVGTGRATRHSLGRAGFAVIKRGVLRLEPASRATRKLQR